MGEDNQEVEIIRRGEDTIIHFQCEHWPSIPSIEDDPKTMSAAIQKLAQVRGATKLIFSQRRDYEYDFQQTQMLNQIAAFHTALQNDRQFLSISNMTTQHPAANKILQGSYIQLQNLLFHNIFQDPISVYVELIRINRKCSIHSQQAKDPQITQAYQKVITIITHITQQLEKTTIIQLAKPHLAGHHIGDRSPYRTIFSPLIKPNFMYTKLMSAYPTQGEVIANFIIGHDTEVTIFKVPDQVQYLYHINPPEFRLNDEQYELLEHARNIMAEHKPERSEFVDPKRMREVFYNVGYDLLAELASYKQIQLSGKDHERLTHILLRYTVGFGLIEILLQDPQMQDISVNSPQGNTPIFIVHGEYDECTTNIMPTTEEADSWATKLRLMSGRSLDEADPILDTELELSFANVRVAAVTDPLSPTGLAFSFRRHRNKPWTLPLFMHHKMINAFGAGLLSFFIDGTRSMLIAGTRSSGKSSLLSSLLVEIMRRYRIITVEDTLELPVPQLRNLGYNIQSLKVASSLGAEHGSQFSAQDGIRSTLRLGDSALIIGEVRSLEAKALYEAMRVGAAANVVAGTIHGDSPYGVFDRVVNDIGVPPTSFKATDIIVIANPIRSADGLHKYRRVLQITEVRKDWDTDPQHEHGFVDLMKYNPSTDQLEPTDALINGDSEIIKTIAANIREFRGSWDAVWENIQLRAQMKQILVDTANTHKDLTLLEADFVIACNDHFHKLYEKMHESKEFSSQRLLNAWTEWLTRQIRTRRIEKDGQ